MYKNKNLTLEELNSLAFQNYKNNDFQEAIKLYDEVLKKDTENINAYNYLGIIFNILGQQQKAITSHKKAIQINPNDSRSHNNLGIVFKLIGKYQEARNCYEKAIEIEPNYFEAHNNLGSLLLDLGEFQNSLVFFEEVIKLKPKLEIPRYNLGRALFMLSQYKKSAEQFKLIDFKDSKNYLLRCLYILDDKLIFYEYLDSLINRGETNAVIGSLCLRSEVKFGVKRQNPFCNDPLDYILEKDLAKEYDFQNTFIETAINILNDDEFLKKTQVLLTNGVQTAGNIFTKKNTFIEKMKDIIHLEVQKYQNHFKDRDDGLIKYWPTDYDINGWLISMKNGGNIKPHIHDYGWISGSIYVNVPPKLKTNNGNLVLCIDEDIQKIRDKKKYQEIINVFTGSLCLFPSSLYHYTIPFESKEDRIVLAFDVVPK